MIFGDLKYILGVVTLWTPDQNKSLKPLQKRILVHAMPGAGKTAVAYLKVTKPM